MRQKANFIHVCLLILDGKFFQVQTGSYFGGNIGSSFAEAIKGWILWGIVLRAQKNALWGLKCIVKKVPPSIAVSKQTFHGLHEHEKATCRQRTQFSR